MPAPSGQIPPPWARWENEAPTVRAACSSSQAQAVLSRSARLQSAVPGACVPGRTCGLAEAAPEVAGHLEWGGVKTHEARTVRLPRSLAEELGVYLAGRPTGRDELVFTAPRGGPLRESKFVPDRFKPAIAAANQAIAQLDHDGRPDPLPEELRLYDLRHTAASLMIRQGASVKAVQRQLGHATASITLDTYGHLFPDELDALAGRLEDARTDALASLARTQRGPAVLPIPERAGQ
jgi:integrase